MITTLVTLAVALFALIIALDIVFTLHSMRNSLKYIEKCMTWLVKVKADEAKSGGKDMAKK